MTRNRMHRMLVSANCVLLVSALAGLLYIGIYGTLAGSLRLTELDRHGVIDAAKLAEYDTELAENLRFNVSHWILGPVRIPALLFGVVACAGAVINLIGLRNLSRTVNGRVSRPPGQD